MSQHNIGDFKTLLKVPDDRQICWDFYEHYGMNDYLIEKKSIYRFNTRTSIWESRKQAMIGFDIVERMIPHYSNYIMDPELLKDVHKKLSKTCTAKTLSSMYFNNSFFHNKEDLIRKMDRSSPYLIPFKDSVFDIRTGQTRKREREDYFTYSIDKDFNPEMDTSEIEVLMREYFYSYTEEGEKILDEESFETFKSAIGYSLTGLNNQKCMFFITGESNTGKSFVMKILQAGLTMNQNLINVVDKTLFTKSNRLIKTDIRKIVGGLRFAYVIPEFNDNEKMNKDTVKKLTDGDSFGEDFVNDSITKFFFLTGDMPKFKGWDSDLDTRLILIPLKNTRIKESRPVLNGIQITKSLTESDLEGVETAIFNWLLKQARAYYTSGCVLKLSKATKD